MAGSQISTSVSIIDSLSGFMALSLTEYNTSAAAAIAAGSKVEIAGAFFQFPSDETPTGWTAITTGTTAYIALTASGTAGSQVVNAGYVSTAPTWRDDLQGWYASAASSVRIVASVYKAEATRYYPKIIIKDNFSIPYDIGLYSSGIYGTTYVTTSASVIIPVGLYMVSGASTNDHLTIQIKDTSGSWTASGLANGIYGVVWSDGINYRYRNDSSTESAIIYYRKIS